MLKCCDLLTYITFFPARSLKFEKRVHVVVLLSSMHMKQGSSLLGEASSASEFDLKVLKLSM